MTTITTFSFGQMELKVLGFCNQLEVTRRVVKRVPVDVVNVLIRLQLAIQKSLHNKSVFRFIVALANHDVTIPIFNIHTGKYPSPYGFSVATGKSVMIVTQALCNRGEIAALYRTDRIFNSIDLFRNTRIAVFRPARIVHPAHTTPDTWLTAIINCAIRFLFWHGVNITQER